MDAWVGFIPCTVHEGAGGGALDPNLHLRYASHVQTATTRLVVANVPPSPYASCVLRARLSLAYHQCFLVSSWIRNLTYNILALSFLFGVFFGFEEVALV